MSIQYINKNCPVCGGYVVINALGHEMCENCHYILPQSNFATNNCTTCTSADRYCERCNVKLKQLNDWWYCPECGYGYRITAGDPSELTEDYIKEMAKKIAATPLYFSNTAVGKAIGSLEPQTLTITNCEKFRVQLREVDIEFELDPDKLENIDTLIINGYKYVKEK
jgi:ribosomal protein S27AE